MLRHLLLLPMLLVAAHVADAGDRLTELRQQATRLLHAEGVPRDPVRARRLYCLGALLGDGQAMYQLGWMHLNGRGVARDDGVGKDWLQRAAQLGDPYARRLLGHLAGTPARPDPACMPLDGGTPDRAQIAAWVELLAPEYQLDPQLVLAVIAAESAFDPTALSPRDARGLMQLIPRTADRFAVADVWNPVDNLTGGMAYLSWLMDTFDHDLAHALAAYNAGEAAVQRHGGIPPYPETRAYVSRIMRSYRAARTP